MLKEPLVFGLGGTNRWGHISNGREWKANGNHSLHDGTPELSAGQVAKYFLP